MKLFLAPLFAYAVNAFGTSRRMLSSEVALEGSRNLLSTNDISYDVYHFAPQGQSYCDYGKRVFDATECEQANAELVPKLKKDATIGRTLQQGNWDHVPHGCSSQTFDGGDNAAHLNVASGTWYKNDGYRLICVTRINPAGYESEEPVYHLAPRGDNTCDYGKPVLDLQTCIDANKLLVESIGHTVKRPGSQGNNWHTIPYGCSTRVADDDYKAHLNTYMSGVNDGDYRLICEGPEVIRDRGFDPNNDEVSPGELASAALAASRVYKIGPGECSEKFNEWTCVKVEEKAYNYWFESEGNTKVRYMFFSAPGNKCGFAFRGTSSGPEWWTNFNIAREDPTSWKGEQVHNGFKMAFDGRRSADGTYTHPDDRVVGSITWFIEHHPTVSCSGGVYFVGHSLGGAQATIADMWYEWKYGKKATSITFGAPMVAKKTDAKKTINELRIIHEHDPVASSFGHAMYWADLEHRGPAKVIRCHSGETGYDTCKRIKFEDGKDGEQTHAYIEYKNPSDGGVFQSYLTKAGWTPDAGYHNMDNYVKYILSSVESKRDLNDPCELHIQCGTDFCRKHSLLIYLGEERYCAEKNTAEQLGELAVDFYNNPVDTAVDVGTTAWTTTVKTATSVYNYVSSWWN